MNSALFDEAVQMTPSERVVFAELLLESIDQENVETKRAWLFEVNQRIKAFEAGDTGLVDLDQIL